MKEIYIFVLFIRIHNTTLSEAMIHQDNHTSNMHAIGNRKIHRKSKEINYSNFWMILEVVV